MLKMKDTCWGFPCGSAGKESPCNVGDVGSIPGEGKGYPLQYSGLENSKDYTVLGVTKSRMWLSNFHSKKKKKGRDTCWKRYASKISKLFSIFFPNSEPLIRLSRCWSLLPVKHWLLNWCWFCLPGDMGQCLEIFLIVMTRVATGI